MPAHKCHDLKRSLLSRKAWLIKVVWLASLLLLVLVANSFFYHSSASVNNDPSGMVGGFVHIDERLTLKVDIAENKASWNQGLSGRNRLPNGEGMLFIFPSPQVGIAFWMKEMQFPIDIIWLREHTIVGITPQVPVPLPGTSDQELIRYSPEGVVDMVLEVPAGWSGANNVKIGQKISLKR